MSKLKLVDRIFNSNNICFVYDPFTLTSMPYWMGSPIYIARARSQIMSTRANMESITYLVYANLIIEIKLLYLSDGEKLITRLLATL